MGQIKNIVIVGAGQAGASAVAKLRYLGFEGRLVLIGEEPVLPYQRPPLSKKYLLGEVGVENLQLRSAAFYQEKNVELILGVKVTEINRLEKSLRTSNGDEISWDRLLLATGARPRQLPQEIINGFEQAYTVRTLFDVDTMAPKFQPGSRVLIVGGGYIGLEAAAVARKRDLETTLIETTPRILQRVAAQETADRFCQLHRENGVDIREGCGLKKLVVNTDTSCTALLSDKTALEVDFVITGIGVDPDTAIAEAAGLDIDNGIATDGFGKTSDQNIFAAGDCASFPWQGRRIRLESVQNANDQAEMAAANMLGQETLYNPVPWFWSDQYEVKLQIAGLNQGYDRIITRTGARAGASSLWYYKGSQFLAVDAFNDPAAYMIARRLLGANKSPDPVQISNPDIALKSLI